MRNKLTSSPLYIPLPAAKSYSESWPNEGTRTWTPAYNASVGYAEQAPVFGDGADLVLSSYTSVSRSNITVNPIVNGWRNPSPYEFEKIVQDGATVASYMDWQGDPDPYMAYAWAYIQGSRFYVQHWYPRVVYTLTPRRLVIQPPSQIAPPEVGENAIIVAMARQAKGNGMNAALALAESRKTAELVAQKVGQLAGAIKLIRKRNPKVLFETWRKLRKSTAPSRAWKDLTPTQRGISRERSKAARRRATRNAADEWLSFIYGVMPIIYDIEDLLEQLDEGIKTKDQLLIARASVKHTTTMTTSHVAPAYRSVNGSASQSGESVSYLAKHESKHRHAGSLWFKVESPSALILKQMGFNNALAVAWDMVPLVSLLTDWVIPIGQYLELLDYDQGLTYLGGSFTEFSETLTAVEMNPGSNYTVESVGTRKYVHLSRKVYSTPPDVPPPSVRNPFRATRAVSAVALLRQRLK